MFNTKYKSLIEYLQAFASKNRENEFLELNKKFVKHYGFNNVCKFSKHLHSIVKYHKIPLIHFYEASDDVIAICHKNKGKNDYYNAVWGEKNGRRDRIIYILYIKSENLKI